ncbi:MAG: polyprenyl synthetase family protein [Eubacteriales bacterium]|jgi:geranylgeranyl diphosphate synthase type II
MEHRTRLDVYVREIEQALNTYLPALDTAQAYVQEAMRYSLLSPGKRIRPMLTLEFCRVCGGDTAAAMPFACALEMVHCYSLIHDDLPCMDDDAMRRGRPTNHVVYGEDFAVLSGDGLQTAAFETALTSTLPADTVLAAVRELAGAAGVYGMLGGQAVDIRTDGKLPNAEALLEMYAMKTGALIRAAGRLGCIAAGAMERTCAADRYTQAVGLAFQIRDDLLDLDRDAEDARTTYPALMGIAATRVRIDELTRQAIAAAHEFRDADFLVWLAQYLAGREL